MINKKTIVIALLSIVVSASAASASDDLKAIVASYLEIQTALAADKAQEVKAPAQAIADRAAARGAAGAPVVKAAKALAAASNLKTAREAFGTLSDAVIEMGKAEGWPDLSGIKIGFCSMVNRSWIQKSGSVANPYYGKSMLTCGTLSDPEK